MKNNKGMTVTEVILSIALISIILIFLLSLFLTVRNEYNDSRKRVEYEILKSNIIKVVGDDIDKYGIYSIERKNENSITITYNAYRETKLGERIKKELSTYSNNEKYYVSYKYVTTSDLTSAEKNSGTVREILNIDYLPKIELTYPSGREVVKYVEITIPIVDSKNNNYDINIFGSYQYKGE